MPTEAVSLAPGVHWIGAFDPGLRTFDLILSTANGTTYNAYAVRGSEGVAIIDTVKASCSDDFFARLEQVARYDEITAIVLNHLEPDHSGALPELLRRAPQARVYLSTRAQLMLKALLKPQAASLEFTPVKTGDTVDLGDRQLTFLHTPYLHWPDTQCTWLEDAGILFSGDIFGCHFCDTRLFNDLTGDFRYPFEYYYAHLMRPFRAQLLEALALIEPLPIRQIAPAHGPVLRHQPGRFIARYRELATPQPTSEKTLAIFYLSAYGNTRQMAEALAEGARQPGVRVSIFDLEGSPADYFLSLIEEADGIVLGSPTINGDAVRPIWDLLASLTSIEVKGKLGAAFGSFGWSGEAVRLIEERLRGLKLRVPVAGLRIKLIPDTEELAQCHAMGSALAQQLLGTGEIREVDFAALT